MERQTIVGLCVCILSDDTIANMFSVLHFAFHVGKLEKFRGGNVR